MWALDSGETPWFRYDPLLRISTSFLLLLGSVVSKSVASHSLSFLFPFLFFILCSALELGAVSLFNSGRICNLGIDFHVRMCAVVSMTCGARSYFLVLWFVAYEVITIEAPELHSAKCACLHCSRKWTPTTKYGNSGHSVTVLALTKIAATCRAINIACYETSWNANWRKMTEIPSDCAIDTQWHLNSQSGYVWRKEVSMVRSVR